MMGKAVTSILEQSYVNLELLIIDDASAKEDVARSTNLRGQR